MTGNALLRIGYLIPEFPSQTHAFFWREAMALEEDGFAVRFLTTRRPGVQTSRHAFTDEARARTASLTPPGFGVMVWLAMRPGQLARALAYIAGLRESSIGARLAALRLVPAAAALARIARAEQLQHVHVHSFANAAHVAALARLLGGPGYSLTLHGDLPVYGRDHRAKLRHAAFATAVTRPLARALADEMPGLQAPVIAMGVDPARFAPVTPPAAPPLRIITVARLQRAKGHLHLLRAMAALGAEGLDLEAVFVGEGPDRAMIEDGIASLGLGERVRLAGPLGESDVLAALHESHVLALTSFGQGEAAPVAVMEAMACGLPVVVSRIGGTADMIDDGRDGILVPQQDEPAIADALRRLATDPALRARMGRAARARAVADFDHRKAAAALGRLIRAHAGR
ncbi:MAG: glycosyltransferase family 4 protein [Rubellimicrobium sp.]|nr:glycosyltransferase family 4 protein [Rubellimicrobium sp.]